MNKDHFLQFGIRSIKFLYCTVLITGISITGLHAQDLYKLSNSKENVVKVVGSSNVHDWTMVAQTVTSDATFSAITGDDGIPKNLSALNFTVNAKSLKSEHSSMDNRTYKVIKADDYPKITFKLSTATISLLKKNNFTVKATGILTIAGTAKTITMQVNGEVNPDNTITCAGQQKLKLTDFNIQPPSFMLGAMKVYDDLTIQYSLNFKK